MQIELDTSVTESTPYSKMPDDGMYFMLSPFVEVRLSLHKQNL